MFVALILSSLVLARNCRFLSNLGGYEEISNAGLFSQQLTDRAIAIGFSKSEKGIFYIDVSDVALYETPRNPAKNQGTPDEN